MRNWGGGTVICRLMLFVRLAVSTCVFVGYMFHYVSLFENLQTR